MCAALGQYCIPASFILFYFKDEANLAMHMGDFIVDYLLNKHDGCH